MEGKATVNAKDPREPLSCHSFSQKSKGGLGWFKMSRNVNEPAAASSEKTSVRCVFLPLGKILRVVNEDPLDSRSFPVSRGLPFNPLQICIGRSAGSWTLLAIRI